MKPRLAARLATGALAAAAAILLAAAFAPLPAVPPVGVPPLDAGALPALSEVPDSLTEAVIARNPLRLSRRPSAVPYDPGHGESDDAPPPRPSPRLTGLLGGTPPLAIVDGIPGVEGGRLVRAGDTVGGLRVASISRGAVRLVGLDTMWTLTMSRP